MKQVDDYKSPWKDKYALTVNDSAYYNLDEYEDEISDSDKNPEARKYPITDTYIRNTSVGTTSVNPAVIGVEIIGRGGRGITQGMISGGTSIVKDVVTDVLTDSRKMIFVDPFKSQTLVIASQNEPTLSFNSIVHALRDIGNSRIDHGRIGTPIVNKKIRSEDDNSRVKIDVDEAEKLDTIVQQSLTNKGNTESSRIEEESLESNFSKSSKIRTRANG